MSNVANFLRPLLILFTLGALSACGSPTQVARYHHMDSQDWQGKSVRIAAVQSESAGESAALKNILAQNLQDLGFMITERGQADYIADIRDSITDRRIETYETPIYEKKVIGYKTVRQSDSGTTVTTYQPVYGDDEVAGYRTNKRDVITRQLSLVIHDSNDQRVLFSASGSRDVYNRPATAVWPEMLDAMLEDFPGE